MWKRRSKYYPKMKILEVLPSHCELQRHQSSEASCSLLSHCTPLCNPECPECSPECSPGSRCSHRQSLCSPEPLPRHQSHEVHQMAIEWPTKALRSALGSTKALRSVEVLGFRARRHRRTREEVGTWRHRRARRNGGTRREPTLGGSHYRVEKISQVKGAIGTICTKSKRRH